MIWEGKCWPALKAGPVSSDSGLKKDLSFYKEPVRGREWVISQDHVRLHGVLYLLLLSINWSHEAYIDIISALITKQNDIQWQKLRYFVKKKKKFKSE